MKLSPEDKVLIEATRKATGKVPVVYLVEGGLVLGVSLKGGET